MFRKPMFLMIIKGLYPPKRVKISDLRSPCLWKMQRSNELQYNFELKDLK